MDGSQVRHGHFMTNMLTGPLYRSNVGQTKQYPGSQLFCVE